MTKEPERAPWASEARNLHGCKARHVKAQHAGDRQHAWIEMSITAEHRVTAFFASLEEFRAFVAQANACLASLDKGGVE